MTGRSKISWTDATWNPVYGCTAVSSGCANCYAQRQAYRMARMADADLVAHPPRNPGRKANYTRVVKAGVPKWNGTVFCQTDELDQPTRWRKPRRVFVCSMSDMFHEAVPFEFIDKVFAVMALCPQHTFQVLTKRPERMAEYLSAFPSRFPNPNDEGRVDDRVYQFAENSIYMFDDGDEQWSQLITLEWPLDNVELGTTIENANNTWRAGELLRCPAKIRFISAEPLLGEINLRFIDDGGGVLLDALTGKFGVGRGHGIQTADSINQVIIGAESGPHRRKCDINHVRNLVQQCRDTGTAVFVKQLERNGRISTDMSTFPEDLRIQAYPVGSGMDNITEIKP